MTDAIEHGFDSVVVVDRDGIEFVVVASGTIHRQPEKGLADDTHQIVHFLFPGDGSLRGVGLGIAGLIPRSRNEHARSDDSFRGHRFQDVTGHLFPHETVIRHIGIEAANDVIAVMPRVVSGTVVFKALALGVANHVQPVTRPAFPILR